MNTLFKCSHRSGPDGCAPENDRLNNHADPYTMPVLAAVARKVMMCDRFRLGRCDFSGALELFWCFTAIVY